MVSPVAAVEPATMKTGSNPPTLVLAVPVVESLTDSTAVVTAVGGGSER